MNVINKVRTQYVISNQLKQLIKISIGILLLYFIIKKVYSALHEFDFNLIRLESNWFLYLIIAGILSLINWGFEAKKWQVLTRKSEGLSFMQAYKSVLAGLSTGLVTPNRLGNFIGRNAFIKKGQKVQAIYQTQLGNLAQFLITVGIGGIVFIIAILRYKTELNPLYILIGSIVFACLGFVLYFNLKLIKHIPILKKFYLKDQANIDFIIDIPLKIKSIVLFYSLLRYLVFILQYNLLFIIFSNHISWLDISILSSCTFLITTIVPSLFFGKLLVRESSALLVFGWVNILVPIILLASTVLWFINLAVPGLLGYIIWTRQVKE